jgi:uncharacterized membrane protein YhiD involved in acid resistance
MHILTDSVVVLRSTLFRALLLLAVVSAVVTPLLAQESLLQTSPASEAAAEPPDVAEQFSELAQAALRLPLAGLLAAVLALRPRRRGTPERKPAVIQTQVILAVIGALVMLVVGTSLARAFGIVGAAGLVRYRAKIDDPKDAGVMLSTLAIGLASGVGLWVLAVFGTVFILILLWVIESFEPMATRRLLLKVKSKNPAALKPKIERLLRQRKAECEIRGVTSDELHYEVRWPLELNTDELSERIVAMDDGGAEVELEQMKG